MEKKSDKERKEEREKKEKARKRKKEWNWKKERGSLTFEPMKPLKNQTLDFWSTC